MTARISVCLIVVLLLGCQGQGESGSGSNETADSTETAKTEVVSATTSPLAESPARSADSAVAEGPEKVCLDFLNALRSGDRIQAGQYLTKQALLETRRANLELEPPGSSQADYQIGNTFYATTKKLVAQVECFVAEPEGTSGTSKLIWILKRANTGWKIAGMMIQEEGGVPNLVSFENQFDVARIKEALGGESSVDETDLPESRTAERPDELESKLN